MLRLARRSERQRTAGLPANNVAETIPPTPSVTASATNYYFATSGNDSNDCLSTGTACQSLAKISAIKWVGGSTINLNRGDTFNGTAYLFGGGTAGGTPPTFSGATWATLQPYGTGAQPIINANGNNAGIRFDRTANRDAWKIVNVDVRNARVAGIDSEGGGASHANGLWIDGVNISSVSGGPFWTAGNSYPNTPTPGYLGVMPAGLVAVYTDNLYWHSSTTDHVEMPAYLEGQDNTLVDGLTATNTNREGIYIGGASVVSAGTHHTMSSGTVTNSHITGVAQTTGMYWGTTAIQFFDCSGCTLSNTEIDHVYRGGNVPDGECFDDEGGCVNLTIDTVNAHDCEGSCYLHEVAAGEIYGPSSGTQWKNTTCTNVATNPDQGAGNTAIWVRSDGNTNDHIAFTNNTINKSGKTQGLYQYSQHTLPPTDTPLGTWVLSGNTINP